VSLLLSVVVCTYDRADLLEDALVGVGAQRAPAGTFEVIVVDNGGGDDVVAVVDAMGPRVPGLRYVREHELGLSQARNTGIAASRAPLVAFMDDDAVPEPGWVAATVKGFSDRAVAAVGGRILLDFERGRPRWLPARLDRTYSGLDLGPDPCPLPFPATPYGANMAVRRDLLDDIGGFRPELGRRGADLISLEETELFRQVAARGLEVRYLPDALVHHRVPAERATVRWLARRRYAQGRSKVRLERLAIAAPPRRARRAMRAAAAVTRIGANLARAGGTVLKGGAPVEDAMPFLFRMPEEAGRARELLRPS